MITKEELLELVGAFSWNYGNTFFIETEKGNFIWKDPDYSGDNTISSFDGDYAAFCKKVNVPYCRDKGQHFIKDYCGKEIKLV